MVSLVEFVTSVCEDPSKLEKFRRDPRQALAQAGFTDAEIALITSGEPSLVRSAMAPTPFLVSQQAAALVLVGVGVAVITNTNTITNTVTNTIIGSFTARSERE